MDESEMDLGVQYRAVILRSFEDPKTTVEIRSEWLYDKDRAEEIVESHRPFSEAWGGPFDGYVEVKEQV